MNTLATCRLSASLVATLTGSPALGTSQYSPALASLLAGNLVNGTGADKAQLLYVGTTTLASGGVEDWDIYSPGSDPLGTALTLAAVKICIVQITGDSTNANLFTDADTLTIGDNGTAAAWLGFFGTNADKVTIASGSTTNPGTFIIASGGTGFSVTSGAHLLRLTNNSGSRHLSYTKIIIGQ